LIFLNIDDLQKGVKLKKILISISFGHKVLLNLVTLVKPFSVFLYYWYSNGPTVVSGMPAAAPFGSKGNKT
jgi:hypothetical protein